MTVPGVGPIVALTFRATVDQPERFRSSKSVGACFGLTPRRYQSGESDRSGAISKAGDASVRVALFEAAHVMMTRVAAWSSLKAWAMAIARRRGAKRAKVALPENSPSSCIGCGSTAPTSASRMLHHRRTEESQQSSNKASKTHRPGEDVGTSDATGHLGAPHRQLRFRDRLHPHRANRIS